MDPTAYRPDTAFSVSRVIAWLCNVTFVLVSYFFTLLPSPKPFRVALDKADLGLPKLPDYNRVPMTINDTRSDYLSEFKWLRKFAPAYAVKAENVSSL